MARCVYDQIGFRRARLAVFAMRHRPAKYRAPIPTSMRRRDCTVFASAAEGEGEWANLVCSGYRGYPVLIYSGDLRESVFYGFPPGGDLAPAWESFSAFNSTGAKIEWRIDTDNGRSVPFAAIHRWFVSADPENPDKKTEVLVVEKVGQIDRARRLRGRAGARDRQSRRPTRRRARSPTSRRANFACGADERVDRRRPDAGFQPQRELITSSCPARSPRRSSSWRARCRTSRRS